MPSSRRVILVAAALGLGYSPALSPARSMTIGMTLCGGGVMSIDVGGRHRPRDYPAACHANCTSRRDDDDAGSP